MHHKLKIKAIMGKENKILTYMERGYSKKKIIFNLKTKGVSDENIGEGINNLKTTYVNSELAAA